MKDIQILARGPFRFTPLVGEERSNDFAIEAAGATPERLQGRAVINVNSTGAGRRRG